MKDIEKKARKRVREIKGFYTHLVIYIAINIMMFLIWAFTSWGRFPWFIFSVAFWGFGLFFHWFAVFVQGGLFGSDWEERKVKDIIEKERTKKGRN